MALWERVNAAYDIYTQTGKADDWAVYEVARIGYNNHVSQEGEA